MVIGVGAALRDEGNGLVDLCKACSSLFRTMSAKLYSHSKQSLVTMRASNFMVKLT